MCPSISSRINAFGQPADAVPNRILLSWYSGRGHRVAVKISRSIGPFARCGPPLVESTCQAEVEADRDRVGEEVVGIAGKVGEPQRPAGPRYNGRTCQRVRRLDASIMSKDGCYRP